MTVDQLRQKADWLRKETLRVHAAAPETRVASALSCVELLTALYYGGVLRFRPAEPYWEDRDRFIASKGHGTLCMCVALADLGFFPKEALRGVCKPGSFIGSIPDPSIPGYETVNGSLGHGLGVACGIAVALRAKASPRDVVVLLGDGELNEGSVWEAIMFAGEHGLDNLTAIVDKNGAGMLGFSRETIDLDPLEGKFAQFRWDAVAVDGHDMAALQPALAALKQKRGGRPKVLVANTVKGKGVPRLEADPLSHIRMLKPREIEDLIESLP